MLTESSGLPEARSFAPGVEVGGRYLLEEQLEYGRVGTVYKALDRQRTDAWGEPQHVALLVVPRASVANAALLEGFKRAFSAVRLLRHPHIVAVYDFDGAGETCFLTMEHVDGASLRNVIDSLLPETISSAEAWNVIAAVGAALLHAHESGIVHGDVRAENVIVAPGGQVKVLFSSACFAASAPFQSDEREDVYGLAELAYELLAGQKPPLDELPRSRRGAVRIDGLSRRQWKALQAGLAAREERTRTIEQLLEGLEISRRSLLGKHAAPRPSKRARRTEPALQRPPTLAREAVRTRGPAEAKFERARLAPGLARRARTAVLVMAGVLAAAAVFLRYGPADIGRGAAAVSGAAIEGFGRYVVDPGYRALAALAPRARAPAATTAPAESASSGEPSGGGGAPGENEDPSEERAAGEGGIAGDGRVVSEGGAPSESRAANEGRSESEGRPASEAGAASGPGAASEAGESPAARAEGGRRPAENGSAGQAPRTSASAQARARTAGADAPGKDAAGQARVEAQGPAADRGRGQEQAEIAFAQREIVASEGQTVVPVEILRSDASGAAQIIWWTENETAIAGDDYANLGRVIESFAPGEASRTVFVPITNDSVPEGRETFLVRMTAVSADGRRLGPVQTARVTIVDDD